MRIIIEQAGPAGVKPGRAFFSSEDAAADELIWYAAEFQVVKRTME